MALYPVLDLKEFSFASAGDERLGEAVLHEGPEVSRDQPSPPTRNRVEGDGKLLSSELIKTSCLKLWGFWKSIVVCLFSTHRSILVYGACPRMSRNPESDVYTEVTWSNHSDADFAFPFWLQHSADPESEKAKTLGRLLFETALLESGFTVSPQSIPMPGMHTWLSDFHSLLSNLVIFVNLGAIPQFLEHLCFAIWGAIPHFFVLGALQTACAPLCAIETDL